MSMPNISQPFFAKNTLKSRKRPLRGYNNGKKTASRLKRPPNASNLTNGNGGLDHVEIVLRPQGKETT